MRTVNVHGITIPKLGLGTWELRGKVAEAMVEQALDVGFRHVDTAQMYENEEAVGAGLRASAVPRDDVFLTTKIWPSDFGSDAFIAAAERSLDRLQTVPDLLLLHWPSAEVAIAETMEAAGRVVERGLAKHIGLSNFPTALMEEALRHAPVPLLCNQVEYHPFLRQRAVLKAVEQHGQALIAFCPLAKGRVFEDPTLRRIAEAHDCGPSAVALAWLLSHERVIAIPRTSKREHLAANFAAQDLELTAAELAEIAALGDAGFRICDFDFAPVWDAA